MAVDTLGPLLARPGTAADVQDRSPVAPGAATVHEVPGDTVAVALVDQGETGAQAAADAAAHPMGWEGVKLPEATKGLVVLPRRWVVERRHAWAARCRRVARDDAQLAETLAGWHCVALAMLMCQRIAVLMDPSA